MNEQTVNGKYNGKCNGKDLDNNLERVTIMHQNKAADVSNQFKQSLRNDNSLSAES